MFAAKRLGMNSSKEPGLSHLKVQSIQANHLRREKAPSRGLTGEIPEAEVEAKSNQGKKAWSSSGELHPEVRNREVSRETHKNITYK